MKEIASATADLFEEFDRSGVDGSAITADGRLWHAGGASEVQELAATVAAYLGALRLLDDHGIDLARAAARIGLALAADADQFQTIAKSALHGFSSAECLRAPASPGRQSFTPRRRGG